MPSKIEIVQRAAFLTGNGALSSLDDGGDVATGVNLTYEAIVTAALTAHGCKFARRTLPLALTTDVPVPPWTGVWALPPSLLTLDFVQSGWAVRQDCEECVTAEGGKGVQVAGEWFSPSLEAELVWENAWGGLYAVGPIRVDESLWPADFAMGIQQQMEAVFLSGISEQRTAAGAREQMAAQTLQRARVRDSRASTAGDATGWDLTAARRSNGRWSAWARGR